MSVANPVWTINGVTAAIVANSSGYDEGQPEKIIRAQTVGNVVQQDFSQNFEEAFSTFKFSMLPNVVNIDLIRSWQILNNANVVTVTGTETVLGVEQQLIRTFNNATITNKPEVNLGADTDIEIEWKSDAAV